MNLRNRLVPTVLLLGVTGCWPSWPRIAGPWSDYAAPTTTDVYAHLEWAVPQGTYWGSATSSGVAFWGVFSQPEKVTGYEFDGAEGGCGPVYDATTLFSYFDSSGTGSTTLNHAGGAVTLPWVTASNVFAASLIQGDVESNTSYDLSQVQFGSDAPFTLPDLLHTPVNDFHLDSPAIDGATPTTVSLNDLAFSWSGTVADRVAFTLTTEDSVGNTLDTVECIVDDTGSLTVPSSLFPNSGPATMLYVFAGPATSTSGASPLGDKAGYLGTAVLYQEGAYYLSGL